MPKLNIQGSEVDLSFKMPADHNVDLRTGVMQALGSNTPFHLTKKGMKGLFVFPDKLQYFDADNNEQMQCQTIDQLQWVLQCSMIIYEEIRFGQPQLENKEDGKFLESERFVYLK